MVAALDDVAVVENHDDIRVADGGQPVGDDEYGAPIHQLVHTSLYDGLGTGIDGGGSLIEDHNRRVGHRRTGDGEQLALALGQAGTAAGNHRIVAVRQHIDKAVGIGQLGRGVDLLIGGIQLAVADVLPDGTGEQGHILKHDAQTAAQVRLADAGDVDAIVGDGTAVDVIEAVDQVGNGGLTGTGGTDKGYLLAGLGVEGDVVQDDLLRGVAEGDMVKPHIALELYMAEGAILFRDLPGQGVGVGVVAFDQVFVLVELGMHQGDGALVLFRLLIQKAEDPLGTGQGHDDRVHLLGYLADGHIEALGQGHKGGDGAQGGAEHAVDGHGAADQGNENILEVAQAHNRRHQNSRIGVGLGGRIEEVCIEDIKVLLGLLLVAEHLDNALAFDHLFDVAVDVAEGVLLADEVAAGMAADKPRSEHDDGQGNQHAGGEHRAGDEHRDEHRHNHDQGHDHVGNGLADHLAKSIGIIGVVAHNGTVDMGIKIPDGQRLHVGEHLVTDVLHGALGDAGHQLLTHKDGDNAGYIDAGHAGDGAGQAGKIGAAGGKHRGEIVIDQVGEEHRVRHIGKHRYQDADDDHGKAKTVVPEDEPQQTAENIPVHVLDSDLVFIAFFNPRHALPLLSAERYRLRGRSRCSRGAPRGCRCR